MWVLAMHFWSNTAFFMAIIWIVGMRIWLPCFDGILGELRDIKKK
jgi:hypothetical protein